MGLIHLTFTGPAAGALFCDTDRSAAADRGDTFAHLPYSNIETFLRKPEICPECLRAYETCDED